MWSQLTCLKFNMNVPERFNSFNRKYIQHLLFQRSTFNKNVPENRPISTFLTVQIFLTFVESLSSRKVDQNRCRHFHFSVFLNFRKLWGPFYTHFNVVNYYKIDVWTNVHSQTKLRKSLHDYFKVCPHDIFIENM